MDPRELDINKQIRVLKGIRSVMEAFDKAMVEWDILNEDISSPEEVLDVLKRVFTEQGCNLASYHLRAIEEFVEKVRPRRSIVFLNNLKDVISDLEGEIDTTESKIRSNIDYFSGE